MTMQSEPGQGKKSIRTILPWLITAAALLVYLVTLNHWISASSYPYIARATGMVWLPELTGAYGAFGPYSPLFYLVTYPFRWLPEPWIPLALNLFSAVCGALTLGLLARSVILLPHDRTHEQRLRGRGAFAQLSVPKAWIAPALAVVVCGLQLSFWENATAANESIFQVLLFAYVIHCLLKYRIDRRDSRLLRATLVYSAAMTGNWLMIGLSPAFMGAMLWIKGISFFNLRFLRGLFLCCLAGLTLYVVLPLIYVLSGHAELSFWESLKINVASQVQMLQLYFVKLPRYLQLLLVTTSVLPILLIGIRWASYFGDPSKLGIAVTTGMLHLAHGALLGACIWTAFDPMFSLRHRGIIILEFNYLGALSVGYFAGYFLLVFRPVPDQRWGMPRWQLALNKVSQGTIWALLFLVPLGLLSKNYPQMRVTNGPAMEQYASLLTRSLPASSVVFCDSQSRGGDTPLKLWLAQAWLARSGKAKHYIFADTLAMQAPAYLALQEKRYEGKWPTTPKPTAAKRTSAAALLKLVMKLSEQFPAYYLNTTFGYYIEFFYQQPHGLALEMKRYSTNSIGRPPLTAAEVAENERFWQTNMADIQRLTPWIQRQNLPARSMGFQERWMHLLHIPFEANGTASLLGGFYSQAAEFWGLQLQKSGRWGEAERYFDLALALNPGNVAAGAAAKCNQELRAGHRLRVPGPQAIREEIGKYSDWQQLLLYNGLFDDPTHCLIQAMAFTAGHLNRQAAQQFERIHEFDPDYAPASLWLARFYASQLPDKSLALLSRIGSEPEAIEEFGIRKRDISMTEVMALFASKKTAEAEQVMQQAMKDNPNDEALLYMVVQMSSMFGRYSNALAAVKRELEIAPTNTSVLLVQGYLQLQVSNYPAAVVPLTRVLSVETNNTVARFNRAIAYLCDNQLDRAQHDYQILEKFFPGSFKIYFGLGEIAWRRNDTNEAIRYYRLYLTNAVPEAEETKLIAQRLHSLTDPSP
jgi:Flp pilus assembly protein TadD